VVLPFRIPGAAGKASVRWPLSTYVPPSTYISLSTFHFQAGSDVGALRVCVSASAADRLSCARDVVRACAPGTRVLIVGATRGAADDLARSIAAGAPATFGLQRLSLMQLAAKTAILTLASDGLTSATWLGTEAVAARVAFDATRDGSL
jgi:hypothetical protein